MVEVSPLKSLQNVVTALDGSSSPQRRLMTDELIKISRPRDAAALAIERLAAEIVLFEATLSNEEEVGAVIIGAPDGTVFHIERLYALNMDILVFEGVNASGKGQRLIQHIGQLSILLTALPKLNEQPRRIGFTPAEDRNV